MELIPKAKGLVTSVLRTDEPQQTHIKKMVLDRTMLKKMNCMHLAKLFCINREEKKTPTIYHLRKTSEYQIL